MMGHLTQFSQQSALHQLNGQYGSMRFACARTHFQGGSPCWGSGNRIQHNVVLSQIVAWHSSLGSDDLPGTSWAIWELFASSVVSSQGHLAPIHSHTPPDQCTIAPNVATFSLGMLMDHLSPAILLNQELHCAHKFHSSPMLTLFVPGCPEKNL
ncbi:unnamed protein product [Ostreobium quekettii]|uniref:Uncharacterized protein n=1 Tax=Ostreobium quekettii TaxID=121088 RepID=A0A8S1IWL6_9CHLO|nr:unnamed protein product [Ostreobium quekettii]